MNSSSKYLSVFSITWQQGLVYRLNFVLWRMRSVLQLLLVYFIWWTVFNSQSEVFGYTQSSILTYILVASLIRAIILSSRVMDVVDQINTGSIVNFLVKPLDLINYYFAKDFADKLLNISFVVFEIILIILLLRPEISYQTNVHILFLFIAASLLGMILYFTISFSLGLLSFWLENAWGPFFLLSILLEGLGGGIFPIDILPKSIANFLMLTPFPYLIYFPSKLYLGTLSNEQILSGFTILLFWVVIGWLVMMSTLKLGLKHFTASGG